MCQCSHTDSQDQSLFYWAVHKYFTWQCHKIRELDILELELEPSVTAECNRAIKVCIDTECDQIDINNILPSICHLSQTDPTGMSKFSFHVIPWIWSLGNTGQHWYWREQILYRINDKNIYSVSSPFISSSETALSSPQTNPILSLSAGGLLQSDTN